MGRAASIQPKLGLQACAVTLRAFCWPEFSKFSSDLYLPKLSYKRELWHS